MSSTWYPITSPTRAAPRLPVRPFSVPLPPPPPPPPPSAPTAAHGPARAPAPAPAPRPQAARDRVASLGQYGLGGGPVNATGYIGAENPPSLFGQAWGFTKSLPGAVAGFGKDIYETAAAPVRLPIDIARGDVSLTELGGPSPFGPSLPISRAAGEQYLPAVYHQAESVQRTAGDIAHPSRFVEASREGTLFGKIIEDLTNVSLGFGGASKALGRAPFSVEVAGREAAAVAGETATRAVGAAPLSVSEALAPAMRTSMRERATLQAIQDVIEPTARETVNFPGRGLAGVAYNYGRPELGAGLARAGDIAHRIGSLGQRAANAPAGVYTFVPRNLNRALQAVGGPDIPALARQGIGRVVEKYGEEGGVLFPFTEAGREVSRLRSAAERQLVEVQRQVVEPAQLVNNLRLKTPLARAAAFLVDEMMFPTIHVLQRFEGRLDDAQIDQIIKEMYIDPVTGKPVSKSMRPTPEDVRVVLDYAQDRLEPAIRQQIDLVADSMGDIARGRRDLLLRTIDERTGRPILDVAQVGDELLPEIVSREDRVQEIARGRVTRTWEKKYPAMVRAAITAAAYDALAAELPEPPRVTRVAGQAFRTGLRAGAESFARERFRTASRDLAQAVDDYQRLVEEGAPNVKPAQNRVLRLTNRVNELRGELERVQRQEQATTALSKVSGEIEPGAPRVMREPIGAEGPVVAGQQVVGESRRPTPDLSTAEGVTQLRARAKELGDEEAAQVFGEIENMVGAERLAAPPKPGARAKGEPAPRLLGEEAIAARKEEATGGEWDWWTERQLPEKTRKRLVMEGWVSGRTRGSIKVRYVDSQTGKVVTKRRPGGEYRGGVNPTVLTRIINESLNMNLSVDEAMALYVQTIERMWEAESGRSVGAIERLANEQGIPFEAAHQAVTAGSLAAYRDALVDPAVRDMNSLREGYVNLTQDERDVFDSVVDSIVNDEARIREGTVDFDLADAIEMMMPEVDMTGSQGVLATFGDLLDVGDVVTWMRTGDVSPTMKAVLAQRTPAGSLQLGALRGQVGGLSDLVREVDRERRTAERELATAERAAGRDLAAAAKRVDNAAEVEQGRRRAIEATGGVVDETPESIAARVAAGMPERVREWERPAAEEAYATGRFGGPYTVEGTPYRQAVAESIKPSPGEVLRMRQGAAHKAYRDIAADVARLERSIAYRNRKIGDMRSELSRGVVDRLVEDVNHPWITRAQNIIRKGGERLGRLRGRRDERYVDGLVGRLARKYHVYDEVVAYLDQIEARRRSDLRVVDEDYMDPFGDPQAGPTEVVAGVFEEVLTENGIVMDSVDRQAFTDSVTADGLLEQVEAAVAQDAIRAARVGARAPVIRNEAGETVRVEPYSQEFHARVARAHRGGPNTPFRLRELIDHGMRDMPDDLKSQLRASWDDYQRRRSNLLNRNIDRYAEAMPARYRTLAFTARRQIRTLLDIAERENQKRYGSGDIYIDMATVTMDTLAEYVDAGIDPIHLIGGDDIAHPYTGGVSGRGRFAQRKLRAQYQRRTGLRTLDPSAQARVEADQLARVMHNVLTQRIKRPFDEGGFGRRADDVLRTQIADHRVRTGEPMAPDDMARAAEAAGWVSTEPRGAVNEQTILIPDAIAKQSQDYSFTQWTAWQWLRSANKKWKSWVLPLSAKWLTGNVFGNVISAWAYAGINPVRLARTMLEIKRMEGGLRELWDRQGLPDWSDARLASHGLGWRDYRVMYEPEEGAPRTITVPGVVPRLGGRTFRSPIGNLIEKSYGLNEFVDNLTRAAVYLEKVRSGVPTEAAMSVALNALGDFTRLSRFERSVVKEIIPFYPWLRHQTQATLRLPIESPMRAAWLLHLADLYTDPEENADLMNLIGSSIPLGGDMFLDIGSVSPFAETDPYRMPFSPTAIGRAITPGIRFPLAAVTGLDLSRWQQLTRPAGTTRRGEYGQEESTPFWYTMLQGRPLQGLGELGYEFTQQVAPTQVRSLRDLALGPNARYATGYEIGSETGKYLPARRGSLVNQLLRAAGLPSEREIDLAEVRRRAREQERRQRG